jgi:hypothetical protein
MELLISNLFVHFLSDMTASYSPQGPHSSDMPSPNVRASISLVSCRTLYPRFSDFLRTNIRHLQPLSSNLLVFGYNLECRLFFILSHFVVLIFLSFYLLQISLSSTFSRDLSSVCGTPWLVY